MTREVVDVVVLILFSLAAVSTAQAQCQGPEIAKLNDTGPGSQYFFGQSVAIDGDVAVVGAYRDWTATRQAGAVLVYRFDGSAWTQEAKLIPTDIGDDDEFGISVGVSGDTLVVGSHFDDDGGKDSGSAYVFTYDGANWQQSAKLSASDAVGWDNFGYSVAIDGDVIVVGANLEDVNGINSGAAYLFEKPAGGWVTTTETAKLSAGDGEENDEFGKSVAVSGTTAVVGAHYDLVAETGGQGSAYVFSKSGSAWSQVAKLTATDGEWADRLGISVAVADGLVVAGAWGDDDAANQGGAVYLFERPSGGWGRRRPPRSPTSWPASCTTSRDPAGPT